MLTQALINTFSAGIGIFAVFFVFAAVLYGFRLSRGMRVYKRLRGDPNLGNMETELLADADMTSGGKIHKLEYVRMWERFLWSYFTLVSATFIFIVMYGTLLFNQWTFVKVGGQIAYRVRWVTYIVQAVLFILNSTVIAKLSVFQTTFATLTGIATTAFLWFASVSQQPDAALYWVILSFVTSMVTSVFLWYPSQYYYVLYTDDPKKPAKRVFNWYPTAFLVLIHFSYIYNYIFFILDDAHLLTTVMSSEAAWIAYLVGDSLIILAALIFLVWPFYSEVDVYTTNPTRIYKGKLQREHLAMQNPHRSKYM